MIKDLLGLNKIPKRFNTYKNLIPYLNEVEGWLSVPQGESLFNTLMALDIPGDVVEIGSFKGKSTVCLAHALKNNPNNQGKLFAVDPHTGGINYVKKHPEAVDQLNSLADFLDNIHKFHVHDIVVPLVCRSSDAFDIWRRGDIKFVYVDGWHSYDAAYNDIIRWGSIVKKGGVIAVDDYSWDDVKKAIADAVVELKLNVEPEIVAGNLALIRV